MRAIRARYNPYLQTRHRVEQVSRLFAPVIDLFLVVSVLSNVFCYIDLTLYSSRYIYVFICVLVSLTGSITCNIVKATWPQCRKGRIHSDGWNIHGFRRGISRLLY